MRFASALGYSGYPHLQKALQELIRHRLTASQRFEMTSDMDHAQVLNKVLKADIQNIRSTLDEMDINAFEDAIEKIIAARTIYVLGLRASAPIAEAALGITPEHYAVLMAAYMALDGMGTACNLTGDGAIALVVDRFRAGGKEGSLR